MGWRVSFYDLMSYLIPGGLAILLLGWFAEGFLGASLPRWDLNLGWAILFLAASLIAGHAVQWFAARSK
jgi:hypothetical protein